MSTPSLTMKAKKDATVLVVKSKPQQDHHHQHDKSTVIIHPGTHVVETRPLQTKTVITDGATGQTTVVKNKTNTSGTCSKTVIREVGGSKTVIRETPTKTVIREGRRHWLRQISNGTFWVPGDNHDFAFSFPISI